MILFLHVFKEYLRYVLGTIVLCMFLFVLFDFMHKTTRYFPKHQPDGSDIALYYLYQLPIQVNQAIPIAALLASVITMVVLSRGNEVTVMRAAGMTPYSIALPLAGGGALLSALSFFISEAIIPETSKRMHFVQDVAIEKRSTQTIAEGVRWVRDRNRLFNFGGVDPRSTILNSISLIEVDSKFRPKSTILAEKAEFSPLQGNWKLFDVKTYKFHWNGTVKSYSHAKESLAFLPIDPAKLQRERRKPDEMSSKGLASIIDEGEKSGKDVLKQKIAWHLKWAYPFAAFFVSLLGLRFGFRSERSNEAVKKVLMAFLTGISYWFILSASRALGTRGDISPFMAAWSANLVMMVLAAIQFWQIRKA